MPSLGDKVYVREVNPYTEEETTSVGLVTYVFSEDDANGDTQWWNAVSGSGLVRAVVFRADGTTDTLTIQQGDKGGEYSTSAPTAGTTTAAPTQDTTTPNPADTLPPAPADTLP